MEDVIIIGAGAAGLSAARILSRSKKSVCILEARNRIGGRIHTIRDKGFSFPVEAGAEFMHGDLPLTKALMREANISFFSGEGRTWNVQNNQLSEGDLFHKDWDVLMHRLQKLEHDMTIGDFLERHFSEPRYASLTDSVKRFVQGYDAADVNKASALALKEEWRNEDVQGYRPEGGYAQLMEFLSSEIQKDNGMLKLSTVVRKIIWKRNHIQILTDKNEMFKSRKVLVTAPVSVLKSGMISFDPPLRNQDTLQDMEVGGVIKFLFEFNDAIWERRDGQHFHQMPGLNFLFSDAPVPTWWTQRPKNVPLLTGWMAGPGTQQIYRDDVELLGLAFQSLAYLFGSSEQKIRSEVKAVRVINWNTDPYALGAYAYATLKTAASVKVLSTPLENTIYFAGEALYEGAEMGTVEAALTSGKQAAERINSEFM